MYAKCKMLGTCGYLCGFSIEKIYDLFASTQNAVTNASKYTEGLIQDCGCNKTYTRKKANIKKKQASLNI